MTIVRGGSFPEVGFLKILTVLFWLAASEFVFGERELRSYGAVQHTTRAVWLREIMRVKPAFWHLACLS